MIKAEKVSYFKAIWSNFYRVKTVTFEKHTREIGEIFMHAFHVFFKSMKKLKSIDSFCFLFHRVWPDCRQKEKNEKKNPFWF